MWIHATGWRLGIEELGPPTRPDPTPADDAGRADELGADPDRREHGQLRRADQPGQAVLGVPRRSKPRADEWTHARSWA